MRHDVEGDDLGSGHVDSPIAGLPEYRVVNLREDFDERRFAQWVDLYNRVFAAGSTHEDPNPWRDWYRADQVTWDAKTQQGKVPLTTLLAASVQPTQGLDLLGGINIEFYRRSGCALVTYIAIDPAARNLGLGRKLLEGACGYVRKMASEWQQDLKAVLFETYKPDADNGESRSSNENRLRILDRMGGRKIEFEEPGYLQPALGPDQEPSTDLYLCFFREYTKRGFVCGADLRTFFEEFALSLTGGSEAASSIGQAIAEGGSGEESERDRLLDCALVFEESCHLEMRDFAIALHFAEEDTRSVEGPTSGDVSTVSSKRSISESGSCSVFNTWEHDLLAHAYLDRKPFSSRCFPLPDRVAGVAIEFPSYFEFSSEGRVERLYTRDRKKAVRKFRLYLSRTRFRLSQRSVWHLALRNWIDEAVYEFDLIKLIQLYEGYEGSDQGLGQCRYSLIDADGAPLPGYVYDNLPSFLTDVFALIENDRIELDGHADRVNCKPCGGTIQIIASQGELHRRFQEIIRLARAARPGSADTAAKEELEELFHHSREMRDSLLATCGIVQGIFDFNEIDASELADILDPTLPELECFHRIHRSTYTSIDEGDRAFDATENDIGISPYLILPHAVLLHDEVRMRSSSEAISGANGFLDQYSESKHSKERKSKVAKARQMAIRGELLLERLPQPNPFNYFTEREFLARAIVNHGLEHRLHSERNRLLEVKSRLEAIDLGKRTKDRKNIFRLLSVLAIISAGEFLSQSGNAILTFLTGADSVAYREATITVGITGLIVILIALFYLWHRRSPGDEDDE